VTDARAWRRLAIAAALSGAAHAAVIALNRIDLPREPQDLPPLAVRIENAPAPRPAATPRAKRTVKAEPRRSRPAVAHVPVFTAPSPDAASPAEGAETAPAQEQAAAEPPATEPPQPVVVATAPATTLQPEPAALPAFPRRGRISFSLVYGRDGFPVGRTDQSWHIEGNRYQLASHSETTGLVDVIRSQHRTYLSRGALTPEGLQPETFLMSRNRGRGVEEARARFDWAKGSISLGAPAAQREESLPRGSQDLVSFMYQLALDPPARGRTRVTVTNGSRLESYELEVEPEEKIETPLGVLRALPIRQVRAAGTETIELWLATEYRHLPVRIRFYGRDGELAGEQVVTEIRLSED
jgi:hypothetical protein